MTSLFRLDTIEIVVDTLHYIGKIGLFTKYDRQLSEYDVPREVRRAIEKQEDA